MTPHLSDLLGVLAVLTYLAGVGAVTVRAVMLRKQQGGGLTLSLVLALVALAYVGLLLSDAPSVLSVLRNDVEDIPPASSFRTGLFAAYAWILHALLFRLARGRLT
ncbi:hypothetical protein K7W42_22035 [Deinococcus sp. HMF7604]|uniref:hypothetical protein n=1 Tax=Deinococcus betulae TaxID=2873312 RepID=UPI001CCA44AA|nr:hypothetical protein [Deinococcus betulae]MBZ9753515.1 hypothetical protein [Deinococcus betulae]